MLFINKLTAPGEIRRVDVHKDTVKICLRDGTEVLYVNSESRGEEDRDKEKDLAGFGAADSFADRMEGGR